MNASIQDSNVRGIEVATAPISSNKKIHEISQASGSLENIQSWILNCELEDKCS